MLRPHERLSHADSYDRVGVSGLVSDAHGAPVSAKPPSSPPPSAQPSPRVAGFIQLGERASLLQQDDRLWADDVAATHEELLKKMEHLDQLQRQSSKKTTMLQAMAADLETMESDTPAEELQELPQYLLAESVQRTLVAGITSAEEAWQLAHPPSELPTQGKRGAGGHLAMRIRPGLGAARPASARPALLGGAAAASSSSSARPGSASARPQHRPAPIAPGSPRVPAASPRGSRGASPREESPATALSSRVSASVAHSRWMGVGQEPRKVNALAPAGRGASAAAHCSSSAAASAMSRKLQREKLYGLGGAQLPAKDDQYAALSTLPPSLLKLVTQLNAIEAALDAASGEAATMTHMTKRDTLLTLETKRRYEALKRDVTKLTTQLGEARGVMHAETSACAMCEKELRDASAQQEKVRHTNNRRLVERGSRAEHSGWMSHRYKMTPKQLAAEASAIAAEAAQAEREGGAEAGAWVSPRVVEARAHMSRIHERRQQRQQREEARARLKSDTSAAEAAAAAAAAQLEEDARAEVNQNEAYAAFILIGERTGAEDEDHVLDLVNARLEQLTAKSQAEIKVEKMRVEFDNLQDVLKTVKSMGGFDDRAAPAAAEPSSSLAPAGAPLATSRPSSPTPSTAWMPSSGNESLTEAKEALAFRTDRAEREGVRALERLESRTVRLNEAYAGLRHLSTLAASALHAIAPRLNARPEGDAAADADASIGGGGGGGGGGRGGEHEGGGGGADGISSREMTKLHDSCAKMLSSVYQALEELHGYATDPKKAAAASMIAKAAFRVNNRERHRAAGAAGAPAGAPATAARREGGLRPGTPTSSLHGRHPGSGRHAPRHAGFSRHAMSVDGESDDESSARSETHGASEPAEAALPSAGDFKSRELALIKNPKAAVTLVPEVVPTPPPSARRQPSGSAGLGTATGAPAGATPVGLAKRGRK